MLLLRGAAAGGSEPGRARAHGARRAGLDRLGRAPAAGRRSGPRPLAVAGRAGRPRRRPGGGEPVARPGRASSGTSPSGPTPSTRPTVQGVTLASMHAAKGLEWDVVFVVGLVDGVVPDRPVAGPARGGRGGAPAALRGGHPGPRAADAVVVAGPQPRAPSGRGRAAASSPGWRPTRGPRAPPARRPAKRQKVVLEGEAGELFERLRAWRSQAAQSASVPAYVVFTDATLQAIAETRPANLRELSGLPGHRRPQARALRRGRAGRPSAAERPPARRRRSRGRRRAVRTAADTSGGRRR